MKEDEQSKEDEIKEVEGIREDEIKGLDEEHEALAKNFEKMIFTAQAWGVKLLDGLNNESKLRQFASDIDVFSAEATIVMAEKDYESSKVRTLMDLYKELTMMAKRIFKPPEDDNDTPESTNLSPTKARRRE